MSAPNAPSPTEIDLERDRASLIGFWASLCAAGLTLIFEALAFGWALLGAGLLWSDRGAPLRKFCAAGSASSFGIYLAHPLMLQALLLIAGSRYFGAHGGLIGWLHRLSHSSFEVLILLFIAVPVIYACAWVIASAVRRTPVSLLLTGREWKPKRKTGIGHLAVLKAIAPGYATTTEQLGRAMIAVARKGFAKRILESQDIGS